MMSAMARGVRDHGVLGAHSVVENALVMVAILLENMSIGTVQRAHLGFLEPLEGDF